MTVFERVVDKLMSGRFLISIMLTATYCLMPFLIASLVWVGKVEAAFLTGYIAGLAQSVLLVIKFYFEREDRHKT